MAEKAMCTMNYQTVQIHTKHYTHMHMIQCNSHKRNINEADQRRDSICLKSSWWSSSLYTCVDRQFGIYLIFGLCLAQCVLCCMFSVFSVEYIQSESCARDCVTHYFSSIEILIQNLEYWIGRWCKSVANQTSIEHQTVCALMLLRSDRIWAYDWTVVYLYLLLCAASSRVDLSTLFFWSCVLVYRLPKDFFAKRIKLFLSRQNKEKRKKNNQRSKKEEPKWKRKHEKHLNFNRICDAKRCVFSISIFRIHNVMYNYNNNNNKNNRIFRFRFSSFS